MEVLINENPADVLQDFCDMAGIDVNKEWMQRIRDYCNQPAELSNAPTANN